MAYSTAEERAKFVEQALRPVKHEVAGLTITEPLGHHRIRLELTGSPIFIELDIGQSQQAIELLRKGVGRLMREDERDRHIERPIRRVIE